MEACAINVRVWVKLIFIISYVQHGEVVLNQVIEAMLPR